MLLRPAEASSVSFPVLFPIPVPVPYRYLFGDRSKVRSVEARIGVVEVLDAGGVDDEDDDGFSDDGDVANSSIKVGADANANANAVDDADTDGDVIDFSGERLCSQLKWKKGLVIGKYFLMKNVV